MIRYRLMSKADCQEVADLYQRCFSHPWSLSAVEEMFSVEGYVSLIAEEEGTLLGYVGMKLACDQADITNVAVEPSCRRRGIAHELLRQLLSEADRRAIVSIFLEVRVSNEAAITLYRHAGFEECGRRKKYYDQPVEDALVMVWNKD